MLNPSSSATPSQKLVNSSSGHLLGLLTAGFYSLFTLLPDSNSLMVLWPWVFIWQVGLLCPVLWLLGLLWRKQVSWLGNELDWLVGILVTGVVISSGIAPFPRQALWYSWVLFCLLAALYAASSWANTPARREGLLKAQAYLSLAFISLSLLLWISQTYLPELSRLADLRQYGVNLGFDFSNIELRNWAPIGHQNHVAAYVVLSIPLFLGFSLIDQTRQRWLWVFALGLSLIDIYTTSSRAGWLGVAVLAILGFTGLLWRSTLPRLLVWSVGAAGSLVLLLLLLANNRLRSVVGGVSSGQAGGELAYRVITNFTGWEMGLSRLFTGLGVGGVPLAYQQYRPDWAGREAEMVYQLHSTPAHLWAELGLWAVLVVGLTIGVMVYLSFLALRRRASGISRTLVGCALSSLVGYGVVSLTDYQLENVSISGLIVVLLAVLAAEFRWRKQTPDQSLEDGLASGRPEFDLTREFPHRWPFPSFQPFAKLGGDRLPPSFLPLVGAGMVLSAIIWLFPVHRAWMLSSQGFAALRQENIPAFREALREAVRLAPWEAYYAHQLGWNLGELGLRASSPDMQKDLFTEATTQFQQGNRVSPNQEFGFTNLGWLLLRQGKPGEATQNFARSARLVPAKRSVFYGLGLSLLAQGRSDLAIEALVLEGLRDPKLITNPVWQTEALHPLYSQVTSRMEAEYTGLLRTIKTPEDPDTQTLMAQLHQVRGSLRWWVGNIPAAREDWDIFGIPIHRLVLDLGAGKNMQPKLVNLPVDGGTLTISAWLQPDRRRELLQQAWVTATRSAPPEGVIPQLVETMNRSSSFDQWLKQNAPMREYRRERAGFGVLSRHIDGPIPQDYFTVAENIPLNVLLDPLVPSYFYAPELDMALRPKRQAFLQKVASLGS